VAETTGFAQRLKWDAASAVLVAYIGDDPASSEAFTIIEQAADSDETISTKRGMARLLQHAMLRGFQVVVTHPDNGAELSRVQAPVLDLTQNPVQLDAIEVTQAIQDLSQSIPLVAEKRTVVRVYLSNYSNASMTVSGVLSLRRGPSDAPVTVASANTVLLDPAQAGNLAAARNDATRSVNFVVPYAHTAEGPLRITIASITDVSTGNTVSIGRELRPVVRFIVTPPLRVRILGMRYQQGSPLVAFVPSSLDFALLVSWLGRAYPVGQVISSQTVIDATASPPFGCGDINAQVAAIRALDMSAGGDPRTHYYGMVSDGGFFMRGCAAGIPATADPSTVASGPTGPATWGWDFDGSYGDWYGGHELGHTFGRRHPGFCGETQDDLQNYPFANGQLAGSADSFVGFDVGDPAQGLPMTALPGQSWHDVMTYCNYLWLSPYTYRGILDRLIAEGS
jgi:hypothetical protein